VGGAGVNAVSRLIDVGLSATRCVAVDTSGQTLARAAGADRLMLAAVTRGLGTGGDGRLGLAAARDAEARLGSLIGGAEVVLVVAGLAGGTGGGAAPEVARVARRLGALTLGFGILPFAFEGRARAAAAGQARQAFAAACDTLVLLDNARALAVAGAAVPLDVALRVGDDVVRQAVQALTGLVGEAGWLPVDLATLRALLTDAGHGCLSLGLGRGEQPALAAMRAALASPLADMAALAVARAALVQVTGGPELAVADVAAAVGVLRRRVGRDCELVVGAASDPLLCGAAQVTLLGAGVPAAALERPDGLPGPCRRPVVPARDAVPAGPVALGMPARQAV